MNEDQGGVAQEAVPVGQVEQPTRAPDYSKRCYASFEMHAARRAEAGKPTLYEVAVSSESEIMRWYGVEVLDHGNGAVDMARLRAGAAVLVDHEGDQVGVVESARIDGDRVLRASLRFSSNPRGQEIERDVADGIRRFISVGYMVHQTKREDRQSGKDDKGNPIITPVYRVVRWEPAEVSIVSVPADLSVGVGRSAGAPASVPVVAADEPAPVVPSTKGEGVAMEEQVKGQEAPKGALIEDARSEGQRTRDAQNAEIVEMCDAHGCGARASEFIRQGLSPDQVSYEILKLRRSSSPASAPPAAERGTMDLPLRESDRRRFSYSRAVLMAAGEVRADGLEAEVDQELKRKLSTGGLPLRGNGVLVPYDLRSREQRWQDAERATRGLTSIGNGAEVVADRPGELIELLRNRAMVINLGARVLAGLTGPVPFPKQDAAGTAYWIGENPGADVSDSDLGLGLVTLQPKTLQASTAYSRQLLTQATIDVESLVRNDLSTIHALALDRAAIHGLSSAGQPCGLYLTPGMATQAYGGVPTYLLAITQAAKVAAANADVGALGWLTTPGMAGKMKTTAESATAAMAGWLWQGTFRDGTIAGYRAASSSQVSATMSTLAETGASEHGIVFGNWNDLVLGLFGALEIVVDPYAKKKRGLIEVTSFQMADIIVRHVESFAVSTGATLS